MKHPKLALVGFVALLLTALVMMAKQTAKNTALTTHQAKTEMFGEIKTISTEHEVLTAKVTEVLSTSTNWTAQVVRIQNEGQYPQDSITTANLGIPLKVGDKVFVSLLYYKAPVGTQRTFVIQSKVAQ